MFEDRFFEATHCDRCGRRLTARIMSWFTEECICMECADVECWVKEAMARCGLDPADYEGMAVVVPVQ